ncbi:hypothetical protein [Emticicia sp. SJ17W-69]|uniref:hypothetical protein n=1 Tax=Emticicia sp. SJ17W-69 TaxID=3421657 RepID=UPI003EB6E09E
MAEQIGLIKYKGNLGGLSGYAQGGKTLIRRAGGGSKEQFNNSPTMERTRENAAEFGNAATSGKLLRDALRIVIAQGSDKYLTARVTQKMSEVIKKDGVNARGQRGVLDDETSLFEGFDFNRNAVFGSVVYLKPEVNVSRQDGNISAKVPAHNAKIVIAAPRGATHYRFLGCASNVNFEASEFATVDGESDFISIVNSAVPETTLDLNLGGAQNQALTSPIFVVVGVSFFQDVNGEKYPLKNGAFNAVKIVKVDTGV